METLHPSYSKELRKIYKKPSYGILSKSKFILKVRKDYPHIPRKEIDAFISKQETQQKFSKKTFKGYYKIVAPPRTFQIDLFFLDNLKKYNKYGVFLLFVDILSRKMFIEPLKSKKISDITQGIEILMDKIGNISSIISDDEFNKESIKKLFEVKKIMFKSVVSKTEHLSKGNPLGIVDSATRNIKKIINKYIDLKDNPKFIDKLDKLVKAYNTSPHSSLNNKSPNEVYKNKSSQQDIYEKGKKHNEELRNKINLGIGDYVRKTLDKSKFAKEKETFGRDIYIVNDAIGNKYQLISRAGKIDRRLYKYTELLRLQPKDMNKSDVFSMVEALNKHYHKGVKGLKKKESKKDMAERTYKKAQKLLRTLRKEGIVDSTDKIIMRKTRSTRRSERLREYSSIEKKTNDKKMSSYF